MSVIIRGIEKQKKLCYNEYIKREGTDVMQDIVMPDAKKQMEEAFSYIRDRIFLEKTGLIYDHIVVGREEEFPTVAEISSGFPNPGGHSTGMEDGMINGATMLDACLLKYEKEKDSIAAEFARKLVHGMLNCAFSAKSEGFLPRAVSVEDGVSHYPDSSRDQYTMFAFGMHRYLGSTLCTPEERKSIAKAVVAIARRAEKNIVPETGYDMLTDEGRPTRVTVMWGDTINNHEYLRLPMLYLLAYEASGEVAWLEKYRAYRAEAYEKSLPMQEEYWALYTLQQMQASIRLCYDADPDEEWKQRFLSLMNIVADYTEDFVDGVRKRIEKRSNYNVPQPSFRELELVPIPSFLKLGYKIALMPNRVDGNGFFALQDGAQVAIIAGMVPHRVPREKTQELLWDAFAKIDLSKHERNLPLYFLDGYYRCMQ